MAKCGTPNMYEVVYTNHPIQDFFNLYPYKVLKTPGHDSPNSILLNVAVAQIPWAKPSAEIISTPFTLILHGV